MSSAVPVQPDAPTRGWLPDPHPVLGSLIIETAFFYYDGPQLFSARNDAGEAFLVTAANETEEALSYLCVPVSEARLAAIVADEISLHAAQTEPEGGQMFVVAFTEGSAVTVTQRPASWLKDYAHWLPSPGVFLGPTPGDGC